ncbi:hypothetical protein GH733_015355 [Mirounga leonina]|nr:hypothetical protein GH733_015355 [Mirounga leonina]
MSKASIVVAGPDICGFGNNKIQVIFCYQGKYHENKKTIKCRINKDIDLYTLIICPNATYEDWEDFEYIPDRNVKKPDDWNEAMDGESRSLE